MTNNHDKIIMYCILLLTSIQTEFQNQNANINRKYDEYPYYDHSSTCNKNEGMLRKHAFILVLLAAGLEDMASSPITWSVVFITSFA